MEDADPYDMSAYTPFLIGRVENITIDSIIVDQRKYNQIRVQVSSYPSFSDFKSLIDWFLEP